MAWGIPGQEDSICFRKMEKPYETEDIINTADYYGGSIVRRMHMHYDIL